MKRGTTVALLGGASVIGVVGFGIGYAAHPDTVGHVLPRAAEEWSAAGTWFAVLLAVIAAVIAYGQAIEARRLRIEQAQPYVVAYIELVRDVVIEIVIKNLGATGARNVRISVDPTLQRVDGKGGVDDVWLPDRLEFLAPGQEWRTYWDFGPQRYNSAALRDQDRHELTLIYDGVDGEQPPVVMPLDLRPLKGRIHTDTKTVHHAAKQLEQIAKTLKGWSGRRALAVQHMDRQGATGMSARELYARLGGDVTVVPDPKTEGDEA
ncbi:hypothetical protein [Isoptericola sp. NPDC055881]